MLLFSKIYEFYCLYGIELLLSGAAGASRYCPALPGELPRQNSYEGLHICRGCTLNFKLAQTTMNYIPFYSVECTLLEKHKFCVNFFILSRDLVT